METLAPAGDSAMTGVNFWFQRPCYRAVRSDASATVANVRCSSAEKSRVAASVTCRQTVVLRLQGPGHLQRPPRQPEGPLERTVRVLARGCRHELLLLEREASPRGKPRASGGEEPAKEVLEFNPRPQQDMLVACLWFRWTAPANRTCFRLPPSRANRRLKSRSRDMIDASSPSSRRTRTRG